MKLDEKGRFRPPPKLPRHAQRVAETLASWPDVHARTHWLLGDEREVDGADFYVGQEEMGHIHLDGEAHVMHTRAVADALLRAKLARPLPWSRSAAVLEIAEAKDVAHALWLFELRYDHLRGAKRGDLLERIAVGPPDRSSRRAAL